MGFTDIFTSSTTSPTSASPATIDTEKDEVFRKLTEELVKVREENQKLEFSNQKAVAEKKEAVNRMRELEDSFRMREGIIDTLERRIDNLELENQRLLSVETELALLRQDQKDHPLSSSDASYRYDQLSEIFSQLRDTLSCAVCYEPYIKDQATSLLCGHSFCRDCFSNWEQRHVEAWKLNPHQQGVYPGPDCPECRSKEVRRGKVRIWALEETVRLVDRAVREIEKAQFTPKSEEMVGGSKQNGEAEIFGHESSAQIDTMEEGVTTREEEEDVVVTEEPKEEDHQIPEEPQVANSVSHGSEIDNVSPTIETSTSTREAARPPTPIRTSRTSPDSSPSPPSPSTSSSHPQGSNPSNEDIVMTSDSFATIRNSLENRTESTNVEVNQFSEPSSSSCSTAAVPDPTSSSAEDSPMNESVDPSVAAEIEEARNLLRPRTPNPYIAVFRR
ncbi:hypothetical protein JCM3765_007775 [Sporobolomyces pararoseus]